MAILEGILREMRKNEPTETRLTRPILWTSRDGRWVVVEGPFPEGFSRTETRKNVTEAALVRTSPDFDEGYTSRRATSKAGSYAKTLARNVIGVNPDWGEVAP